MKCRCTFWSRCFSTLCWGESWLAMEAWAGTFPPLEYGWEEPGCVSRALPAAAICLPQGGVPTGPCTTPSSPRQGQVGRGETGPCSQWLPKPCRAPQPLIGGFLPSAHERPAWLCSGCGWCNVCSVMDPGISAHGRMVNITSLWAALRKYAWRSLIQQYTEIINPQSNKQLPRKKCQQASFALFLKGWRTKGNTG